MRDKAFTDEQLCILMNHPYVARVTPYTLSLTYEFKQLFLQESARPRMTSRKIFTRYGLGPELIGESRIKNLGKRIRREASSPEGLRPVKEYSPQERRKAFAQRDLSRASAADLRAMQKQIVELQQEVDFLKKLSAICSVNSRRAGAAPGGAVNDTS